MRSQASITVLGIMTMTLLAVPASAEIVEEEWVCGGPQCVYVALERLPGVWFERTFSVPDITGLDWRHANVPILPRVGYYQAGNLLIPNPATGQEDPYPGYKLVLGAAQISPPPGVGFDPTEDPVYLGPYNQEYDYLDVTTGFKDVTITIGLIRVWFCTMPWDGNPPGPGPGGQCAGPSSPGDIPDIKIE